VTALGADIVVDYHDPDWTSRAIDAAGSAGIRAAANAARDGEADAFRTLVDGGRLATITGAPPPTERDISIADVYVRPDGDQLRLLAAPSPTASSTSTSTPRIRSREPRKHSHGPPEEPEVAPSCSNHETSYRSATSWKPRAALARCATSGGRAHGGA
jgi:hypothetical protein